MKRLRRFLARGAAVALAVVMLYALLLAFPEPLFAHRLQEGSFAIYSREPIQHPHLRDRIREAERRISRASISDPAVAHRVFVTGSKGLWVLMNGPYHRAIARNVELGNAIFLPDLDASGERVRHFDGRSAPLEEILAHEAVHSLVQRRVGMLTAMRLPFWKKEGYAQYAGLYFFDPREGARRLAAGREGVPRSYLEAAEIWSYLDQVKGESFDEILERPEPMEVLLKEALSWVSAQEGAARGSSPETVPAVAPPSSSDASSDP